MVRGSFNETTQVTPLFLWKKTNLTLIIKPNFDSINNNNEEEEEETYMVLEQDTNKTLMFSCSSLSNTDSKTLLDLPAKSQSIASKNIYIYNLNHFQIKPKITEC